MPPVTVTVTIPEGEAAAATAALVRFTGLAASATPKQLVAGALRKVIAAEQRRAALEAAEASAGAEPAIT